MSILAYEFTQNAVLAGLMASIVCGLIGPFIVARRMVFISGGLSHAAFGGLGIAYWLGLNPLLGAFVFVLSAAYVLGRSEEKKLRQNDLIIGILWAVGVAIGILFINLTPGYTPDLMIFLFGNILTVTSFDLRLTFLLVVVVSVMVGVFYKGFVAITIDEQYARTRRLPVSSLKMALMMLTAFSIVILIQAVGILLVLALLTIPVAISAELSANFRQITFLSIAWGCLICLGGLAISFLTEAPAGASIILLGAALLGLVRGARLYFGKAGGPRR